MKVNTLERRVLAWILVFALFLSNIPVGVLAEEIQPDASQNQEAPVLETQPETTEQTEPADDETQPSVPETEPEAPTVETTVQCTCGAEGDVHSADCVLYVPTFYEKLLAAQTLKELRDLLTANSESAAALTAAELTSLKVYAEQLFAAASTEENQGYYNEIMSVLSQLLGQTPSEEPEASAPADVVEGTVPVVENDRYDESQDSYADATALENFEYTLDETTATVLLTKYIGTATAVIVAPQYTLENVVYATVLDSATVFRGNTKITSVKLYEGVQFSNYTMSYLFYGCTKLVSVDMHGVNTTGVTDMSYMFYKCSKMTTLDMTGIDTSKVITMYALLYECYALKSFAGYQNWNTSSLQNIFWMFNKVQGMQVVDLSKWDMSQINNSAWCFQNCYAQQILLPDNLKTMSAGFLNHAHSITGSTFTIPAGVQKIGYAHTIYDFATDDFVEFIVAEGNTNYVAIDGILYSADGKEMLAIPRNKTFENNTYAVPEGVEFFGELSFSRNSNIHTLLLPNSYEIVQNIPKHDPRYIIFEDIGNLNAGNSLTIAIYVYTGITDYAVKDDNPRYESIDGIIYSEDMTTVLAIPTKYNHYMNIPEGVTTFAVEAMWAESATDSYLSKCTGISIPSTLTDIAPDQLAKLNRLNKRADFTVEVHPDNPVYALNEEGTIETVGTVVARNENTRAAYTTLADALAAAADDETITLLTDITLGENLTVSADVTINGDGHTITRDDAYTGTMLTISEGATLTLDGGVVIDGGNEWVFHRDEFLAAIEEFRNDYSKQYAITAFRTFEEGAPQATNDMIKASGSLILNHATVQNHVGTGGNISAIYVAGTGALTINEGASIRHNYTYGGAGTLHTAAGSTAVMNAGEIADNYGGNRNGPNIDISGSFTMNGGKIHHNYGIKTNGIVLFLHDGGTFILRDGEICENAALKGDSGWHCAIYIHNNATMEMHGGKVWHNSNRISAIHLYGSSSKFIFTGGLLIENDIQQSSYSAYSDINPTYGPAVVSGGTCTNDVGAYVEDGYGLAIDRKTVNGKDYVYYTTSDQLIQLKSNGKIYPTFDAAMEDAVDGDTLTVLRDQRVIVDATKSESTVLDKDVTIDFNGKTVYGWGTQNPVFRILADVTITGNGTMDAMTFGTGNAFGIGDSETAGTLTIKDGNHYANTTIASVTNGTLNVEGGYFEATPYVDENGVDYGHRYTLCCEDTAYGNGSAAIHVSGGTYYGFDPQNNLAQGEGTDFVTDNHWSLNNSAQSTWTVHPYITVTFQDARMFVGDSVPAVQYTVDYGTVGQDKVKVVVEPAVIENPALGEYELTGTVKLIDGTDKAENYRMAVIPGTLRVMDIVARIVETGERYGTLADAIADANALETATVELLKDVEFNQLLTVTGDVTVLGNGHTVIRGKQADDAWYTDTLFDVSEGASLTLDGNLTIDGNHAWTYRETDGVVDLKNAVDNYQDFTGYDGLRFVSVKADKPVATADMFTVKGALTLDAVTIQNHYGTISTSGTAGGSSVIEIGSTGTLTMNEGAVLTHNAMPSYGTLVYMVNGSRFDMNGGVMSQNASAHHGVCIYMEGGVTTVNGGKVMHNHTCGGQGIFVRINNGELIVNGGEVYENAAFPSTGNSRNKVGAVIDATSRGKVTINDVHIHDNFGYFAGGINHVSLKGDGAFTITGGKFVNNTAWGAFDEDSRLSDVSFGRPGTTVTGGIYSTEIYQACVLTANKDSIIPSGHEQFVIGTDAEGNPNLWEVAPGWIITFQDEEGNVLQRGPVRAGEIPAISDAIPPLEEGYGIFWDKPLAPATEDATYTMTIKLVVAEVVNGDTYKGYFSTVQDAVDAAASGDTVRLLVDNLPVTSVVTVSDKEITLDGNSKTLVREDSYTGAFFNVPAGGSLTIGGDLIIDGGNEWTYNETDGVPDLKTVVDNYTTRVPYTKHSFITYEPGAPIATVPMMTVGGCVVLDDVTIQNNVGTRIVQMASGGKLTTNSDTVFTHNAGTLGAVINVVSGSEVIMDGGTITQTVSHEHGGCIRIEAGTVTMNDGLIHHNYTTGQGSAVRLNGGAFVLNGGDICENVAMPFMSSGNNAGAAIDNTKTGVVTINGGSIHNNFGYMAGGINHIGSSLTITGGSLVDNTAWGTVPGKEGYYGTDNYHNIFYAASSAKPVIITGGIFGTEIYGACTATAEQDQLVTPAGYEEFVIGTDAEGNLNLWEVAPGWIITFQDDEGNVLQSGPVREGTIPVFSSAIPPHEDGYGIFWDKPLVPVTEDATYTLVWKLIVAEVVNGDTHKGYFATLQDAVDAAVTDDTVRILVDIPMTAKVTVTGKDITLDGNNLTITRGKLANGNWYTGTFFTVSADASLTLDGNLTIDGGNNWTRDLEGYLAALRNPEGQVYGSNAFVTTEAGAPIGSGYVISVSGGSLVMNNAVIQNNVAKQNVAGGGAVTLSNAATLTMNEGAAIKHCAGYNSAAVDMNSKSHLIINDGAAITDNTFNFNGGTINVKSSTVTMNGGEISHNRGVNGNGCAIFLNGTTCRFEMNGGKICSNSSLIGGSNGRNAAIQLRNNTMVMTGGTICHNEAFNFPAIETNNPNSTLIISGGSVRDNLNYREEHPDYEYWPKDDLKDIGGEVVTHPGFNHTAYPNGNPNYRFTGGIFSQYVEYWCAKDYEGRDYYAFLIENYDNGEPYLWEVAPGWMITFQDDEGNELQSGPVREGNLPVFEGEVDSREGYLWSWDKELVPATEDATYKMVWKQIVAEVFVTGDESKHKGYFTSLQDAVDAAATGDTVRILLDIPLTDKVTVSGKDIILDGNNLTVTRGKLENGSWYTGTLITVGKGASLTLDGNLTVDGAHAWIFKKDEYEAAFENFKVSLDRYSASFWFVDNVVGAPIATGCMISVAGSTTINDAGSLTINDATLCNNKGGRSGQAIGLGSKAALTMNDGAVITHIANSGGGSALYMASGSVFTMNGGEITDNHIIDNGMIFNDAGTIIMNGGRISDNHAVNCNGTAIMLTTSGKLIMNDGEICRNSSLSGLKDGNGFNSAIYLHGGTSSMEMHGGYIYQNVGSTTGGIHVKLGTGKLVIDGGWVVENVSMLTEQTTRPDLVDTYSGINDVSGNSITQISGITYFTQDVNKWCTTEYISVPQDPGSMGISDDFTLWIVDKTTMDSRSEETEIFGTVTDTDTAVSRDSAYTVVFDVDHFYNRCYQSPMLHFSQDLPENTTLILQNMGRGESGYWGYTVQDQTNDIPLSAFIRMGTADEAYETPMVKPEFQVVVDFSDTTGGMPVDTLETSLYLVPADMLPTDDPDYYVSGAVRWITEEDAEGLTETVSITSVEDIALADYDCTLTSVSSDGLENTLSYTLQFREPASKWDYRELALLVTIPDLPNDAHLFLNGSTQPIHPYEDGTFIVPLGSDFDGQVTLTLASDVFPTEGGTYQATCRLYAAATIADAAPLNGQYLDRQVTCTFTSQADFASVDVIEVNDKRLFTAEDRITVKVANILSSQYGIEVKLEMKGTDGTFVAMNRNYEQNGNTVTYSLNDCDPGSYRIRAIVKDETGGNVVMQESYYFIVD